jgi:SAM-dependent methyltransferase
MSEGEWLALLTRALEDGVTGLPGGPSPEIQRQFVGWAGGDALREVHPFYLKVRAAVTAVGPEARVLDFGVGWGRVIGFFARGVRPENLIGVDVDAEIIDTCVQTGVPGQLSVIHPDGQLDVADGSIDVAYCYSVFSHLSEANARHWISELGRVVKPGGRVLLTTQGLRFIDLCRAVRSKKHKEGFDLVIDSFLTDPDRARKTYKSGEFVYGATGGGGVLDADHYGWAAVPRSWWDRVATDFIVETEIDDPAVIEQCIFVLRRR